MRDARETEGIPTLDALLNQWAARQALSAERAEAIRQAALLTPDEPLEVFTYTWWNLLFGGMKASLRQSNDFWRTIGASRPLPIT
jgi:hypothetical protein